MSGFRAVNTTTLTLPARLPGSHEETTPTTPRQNRFFTSDQPTADPHAEDPAAKTPTRDSFNGISGQKPLPTSPFKLQETTESGQDSVLSRENSYHSIKPGDSPEDGMEDDELDNLSDNGSVSDSVRQGKKKKGQRFFCKDYPPCQLSFTRSEHLARHIRYVLQLLLSVPVCRCTDKLPGSTLANAHFNAIAHVAFPA
jgi:C2H2 transcription facotor